jgi:hypothetical protein
MKRLARPWVSWTSLGMLTVVATTAMPRPVLGVDGPSLPPASTAPAPSPEAASPATAADETPLPLDLDLAPIPAEAGPAPAPSPAPVATDNAPKPLAPVSTPAVLKPVPSAAGSAKSAVPKSVPPSPNGTSERDGIAVPAPVEIAEPSAKTSKAASTTAEGARAGARPALPPLQPRQLAPAPQFAGDLQEAIPAGISAPRVAARPQTAPVESGVKATAPSIAVTEPTVPVLAVPVPSPVSRPTPAPRGESTGTPSVTAIRPPGNAVRSIPVTSTVPLALEPKLAPPAAPNPAPPSVADATPEPSPVPVLKAPSIAVPESNTASTPQPMPATSVTTGTPGPVLVESATGASKVAAGASENGSASLPIASPTTTPSTATTPAPAPSVAGTDKPAEPVLVAPKATDSSGAGSEVREPKNVPAVPDSPAPVDVAKPTTPADKPADKPTGDAAKPKVAEAAPEKPRDPLLTLVDQAIEVTSQRQLRIGMNSPWQIVHGVVALRWDMRVQTQDGKGSVSAIEYLMAGNTFENQPIWQETAWGGRGHPYTRPYAHEGHPTQFLGYMTMANIPLDYEIKTPTRVITVRDVINDAKMQVRQGPEITWTLWALAHYEDSDAQWRNNANEPWSIERLVKLQVDERVTNSACGGCHGMFALCYARNLYFTTGKPLTGVWLEADQKIKWYTEATRRMQNTDGSLSSNFYKGPGYSNDYDTRLNTTGHQLEWILVSLPQSRLGEPWVRRAVESLSRELITNAKFPAECGPMYHSLHALILYRQRLDPKYRIPKRNSAIKLAERELTKGNTIAAPQPGAVRR